MINSLENSLKDFDCIGLKQLDQVKLLDRTDTKYLFNISQLDTVLVQMMANYFLLEVNGVKLNKYETLYFDTPDFKLYNAHHNQRLNRVKYRSRKYVDSGLCFFEVKTKTNKDRTIKERIKRKEIDRTFPFVEVKEKLQKEVFENLVPMLFVNYTRLTFASKQLDERVTIDLNLTFKTEDRIKSYEQIVIAELKQNKLSKSVFRKIATESKIPSVSISKYCIGVLSVHPMVKQNNFKEKLRIINKISYGSSTQVYI